MQQDIDITTEQSFRYMELADTTIRISKNASLCQAFANLVTYVKRNANITEVPAIHLTTYSVSTSEELLAWLIASR